MSRLTDAVSWSGSDVTLILFVVWESDPGTSIPSGGAGAAPAEVRSYRLEDLERRLDAHVVYEYDLVFGQLPDDLDAVVSSWLASVLEAKAEVGWFAFEGSFDFDHLLTADIANQVFAVADSKGIRLALNDDHRQSAAWVDELAAVRNSLLS